jgi:hypothetical protein
MYCEATENMWPRLGKRRYGEWASHNPQRRSTSSILPPEREKDDSASSMSAKGGGGPSSGLPQRLCSA